MHYLPENRLVNNAFCNNIFFFANTWKKAANDSVYVYNEIFDMTSLLFHLINWIE